MSKAKFPPVGLAVQHEQSYFFSDATNCYAHLDYFHSFAGCTLSGVDREVVYLALLRVWALGFKDN